jgi:hypothetical protein
MTDSEDTKIKELMMSPTLQNLLSGAQGCPLDLTDPEEIKAGLSTTVPDLILAIDNNRIHFESVDDIAIFHGLLTIAVVYLLGTTEFENAGLQ